MVSKRKEIFISVGGVRADSSAQESASYLMGEDAGLNGANAKNGHEKYWRTESGKLEYLRGLEDGAKRRRLKNQGNEIN